MRAREDALRFHQSFLCPPIPPAPSRALPHPKQIAALESFPVGMLPGDITRESLDYASPQAALASLRLMYLPTRQYNSINPVLTA
jgi:hypothetical protein